MTLALDAVRRYQEPPRVDLMLSTHVIDYYRVFPEPVMSDTFLADIQSNGVLTPLRIYTNGVQGVLRDGHHRLTAALRLKIYTLPVHVVPDWLSDVYIDYELRDLEPLLTEWLAGAVDFTHQSHTQKRADLNHRLTEVLCSCGASWREGNREKWESVVGGPRR